MLGGRVVTRYKKDGEQYDVVVQTESSQRSTPEDIDKLFVRGKNDTMIPLASLVKTREVVVPRDLNHFASGARPPSRPTCRPTRWVRRSPSWMPLLPKCCPWLHH